MALSPIPTRQSTQIKRMEFLALPPGNSVIRVIDDDYVVYDSHYINGTSIACLGEDCPICKNNHRLIVENPDNFRDCRGYYPRSARYFINVLDRTVAKICPECGAEVKQNIPTCPKCSTIITAVKAEPLNKVKILAK